MSLVPLKTSINASQPAFIPYFSTAKLNASSISTGDIIANTAQISSILCEYLSTISIDAEYINNSTINTLHLDLDGQILTANATELLLNGVPLATTANLSSLADWAIDPAISTVQMQGNDLDQAGTVSSVNIRAGNGFFTNLMALNSMFVSTATSTISTSIEWADLGNFSTLNAGTISSGVVVASTLSANTATLFTLGAQGGSISTLSTFNTIVEAGGSIELQNFGVSFASVGSAQLAFDWFYQDGNRTDMFYDTTISSVRMMTKTPGAYTDAPPSRLHVPQAGISSLGVSSINGSEFTSTGIVVQVAGVSSLVANSISSIGAEIRQALMSSIVFSPSLNPSLGGVNVNLGLGGILGNVIGWGAGVFGAAAGAVGLITGITALATGRQTQNITNNVFETVNGTTQLQFSTLGTSFSTIYRLNDSIDPTAVPGQEIFISTIHPPGVAVRSISDPLYTLSTPSSTIQAFGQWVAVPDELVNISSFANASISSLSVSSINNAVYPPVIPGNEDWALYPAVSTINFSTGVTAVIAASPGSDIALSGTAVKLIGGYADAQNLLVVSTISAATILGANNNLFGIGVQGLELRTAPTGQVWLSTPQTNIAGFTNASTVGAFLFTGRTGAFSTLNVSSATISSINGAEFPQPVISSFANASISSATISTINGQPFSPITNAYTTNILWSSLSTTTNILASTTITTYTSSYIVAQANTTIQNQTNQYHDSFFYLTIDGGVGPSTVTTAVNKTNSHFGQTISYRVYVGPGTWPITANGYADADGDLLVTQLDLWATGGLL